MKKKWGKRIVGLGMAAVLLVGSLAGCGKEPASMDGSRAPRKELYRRVHRRSWNL